MGRKYAEFFGWRMSGQCGAAVPARRSLFNEEIVGILRRGMVIFVKICFAQRHGEWLFKTAGDRVCIRSRAAPEDLLKIFHENMVWWTWGWHKKPLLTFLVSLIFLYRKDFSVEAYFSSCSGRISQIRLQGYSGIVQAAVASGSQGRWGEFPIHRFCNYERKLPDADSKHFPSVMMMGRSPADDEEETVSNRDHEWGGNISNRDYNWKLGGFVKKGHGG